VSDETAALLALARAREARGDLEAATIYDRLYGLDPENPQVVVERARLLDRLAISEHGITFRYVPAGTFLMGAERGHPDERPVHRVDLDAYWLSETPVSWATYCRLMDWEPPPHGRPRGSGDGFQGHYETIGPLLEDNKIRIQYCEDATRAAGQWIWHVPEVGDRILDQMGGAPVPRAPEPPRYELKPMVSVSWQDAEDLCELLSTGSDVVYRLPTEAEWEKAARGGLVERAFPWGDAPPNGHVCDSDGLEHGSIRPMRQYPPNGYGLYAMSGGVWEWTADWYDADNYRDSWLRNPAGPAEGYERVLRGGSWTDCADVVRVSFRMSRVAMGWRERGRRGHQSPNIGFRLCRVGPVATSPRPGG
jgi:formylglycine-generating enzyme required for sulfatase activity